MAPLHPSDSHTNTHSCHYYKTRLQNIISSVPDRVCAKPSCGSKTHRQVRRLRWTEPLLSLLRFSDLFCCVPLLSAVFLPSPLLTVASFHFSVFNLSSLIHRLTSGHKPSLRFIARPKRVREPKMRRSVLTEKESWKTFWEETAGELEQFHLKVILLKTSLLSQCSWFTTIQWTLVLCRTKAGLKSPFLMHFTAVQLSFLQDYPRAKSRNLTVLYD